MMFFFVLATVNSETFFLCVVLVCCFLIQNICVFVKMVGLSKSAARESATVPTLISQEATRLLQEFFMAASAGPGDISRTKIFRVC